MKEYTLEQQLKNANKYADSLQNENLNKMLLIIALVNKLGGEVKVNAEDITKAAEKVIKYESREFGYLLTIEDFKK